MELLEPEKTIEEVKPLAGMYRVDVSAVTII
jgi:hypothetical protein